MKILLSYITDLFEKEELPGIDESVFKNFTKTLTEEIKKVHKEVTLQDVMMMDNPLLSKTTITLFKP